MIRKILGFVVLAAAFAAIFAAPASAQLDPLLFIKDTAPFVLVAVDTSNRMQRDATGAYYDPFAYSVTGAPWEATLGIAGNANALYRRKYSGLTYVGASAMTSAIQIVTDQNLFVDTSTVNPPAPSKYSLFEAPTRMSVARAAIYQAIVQNLSDVQFGLVKMRQAAPAPAVQGGTSPIVDSAANQSGANPTENAGGTWKLSQPTVGASNGGVSAAGPILVNPTSQSSNQLMQALLTNGVQNGGLIPAGVEPNANTVDAPINNLLLDAQQEAAQLIGGDTQCTNTIVVLITGGGEGTTTPGNPDPTATASGFLNVSGGRRVPIYVVAIAPPAADVPQLKAIAANSGGQYFEITMGMINAALASPMLYGARNADGTTVVPDQSTASPIAGTVIVPELVAAINVAVQHGFASPAAVNTAPTAATSTTPALPFGPFSEFQTATPIIGTVDLEGAKDIAGNTLPNTKIVDKSGAPIPQRSNVTLTTAFLAPGAAMTLPDGTIMATSLNGSLRAFRQYVPQLDPTQTSGYRFVADGTRLWVACAPGQTPNGMGQPPNGTTPCGSAGIGGGGGSGTGGTGGGSSGSSGGSSGGSNGSSGAANPMRNLYTAKPDGTIIPFNYTSLTDPNLAVLASEMGMTGSTALTDAANVINWVRNTPIGTMVDSTPAVMNAPSLDPPPDDSYPGFATANVDRRSIVWVGTNTGVLEGIDARLGVEVWGFIPLNLLPKLKVLRLGQGLTTFEYTMDGSPKVADVRIPAFCDASHTSDCWRTQLTIGEGPGGMFYQSFDVTLKGMGNVIAPNSDDLGALLTYFANPAVITLNWEFPTYADFDPTRIVFDANSDSYQQFGDLLPSATTVEKTVGQTWSDPAIGQVVGTGGAYSVLMGSGFLPYSTQQQTNRGGTIAGTTFYVLSAKDGTVYTASDVGSDGVNETVDDCSLNLTSAVQHTGKKKKVFACNELKNALQSDPVTTGPNNSPYITEAYMGDLDGNIWRWNLVLDVNTTLPVISTKTKLFATGQDQPIFSSLASINVGGSNQYVFFGSGSDLLPSTDASDVYHIVGILDQGTSALQQFSLSLSKTSSTDEKVSAFPAVAGDIVFFTTTTFMPGNSCVNLQNANLYALTFIGGPAYDANGDSVLTNSDRVVKTIAGLRATAPFIVDQHLVFGAGGTVAVFGDSQFYNNGVGQAGVRILSWREVR